MYHYSKKRWRTVGLKNIFNWRQYKIHHKSDHKNVQVNPSLCRWKYILVTKQNSFITLRVFSLYFGVHYIIACCKWSTNSSPNIHFMAVHCTMGNLWSHTGKLNEHLCFFIILTHYANTLGVVSIICKKNFQLNLQ